MRMAHVVSEMSAFSTNCTLCHDSTSLSLLSLHSSANSNNSILSEICLKCKKKFDFFQNNKNRFLFYPKPGIMFIKAMRRVLWQGGKAAAVQTALTHWQSIGRMPVSERALLSNGHVVAVGIMTGISERAQLPNGHVGVV